MNWADYLDWGAREDPRKPLVYCDDAVLTYGEMRSWTNRIGNALVSLGVGKGERVATYLPATPCHEAVLIGSLKVGAIACPLSLRERDAVLVDLLRSLEARVLVVGPGDGELANDARRAIPQLRVVTAGGGMPGFDSLDDACAAASDEWGILPMRDNDTAFIAFTGGTTGSPKGVQVTARMLRAQNYAFYERFRLGRASEVFFGMVSFSHVGGIVIGMALPYTTGASHVLLPKWDTEEALRLIARHRVTCTIAPTTMYQQLSRSAHFTSADWSSLKVAAVGGEPVPQELKERWLEVTGAPLREGFGMSEASVQVCVEGEGVPPGSCGWPYDRIAEVRLVDPATRLPVAGAGSGELAVRGDQVTPGYWRNPEQTGRAFDAEGWYYTGDMLRRDEEGYFYSLGRQDDMFQSGGENVYASEVEAGLLVHPDVTKAFCFPEPHPEWGKVPCVVVELCPGASCGPEELLEFCASHPTLARFKRPRRVFCIDALPLGPTGKVVRRHLKEWLAGQGYEADI